MPYRPCLICGEPTGESSYCQQHRRPDRNAPRKTRGYDEPWIRLSKRARRMQPFCTDCGTTNDLTTDHTPEAWARKNAGLPIRLTDVAVVCRSCNSKRGAARGPNTRGDNPLTRGNEPPGEAKFESHTPGGIR